MQHMSYTFLVKDGMASEMKY